MKVWNVYSMGTTQLPNDVLLQVLPGGLLQPPLRILAPRIKEGLASGVRVVQRRAMVNWIDVLCHSLSISVNN